MTITRSAVVDALKDGSGWGISYRGFINSKDQKMLAVDPVPGEEEAVEADIRRLFPSLTTEIISCLPYRNLRRIIVGGFE
jgi:hypothetical protein